MLHIVQLALALVALHPLEALLLVGVILNLLNGVLPARVRSGPVGLMLHVVLDRVTVLTRRDAPGTLKWPLVAGSLLRGVAEALDPSPAALDAQGRPTLAPGEGYSSRRAPPLLALAMLSALAFAAPACSAPRPVGDGGVATPVAWTDTARQISTTLRWALPALDAVVAMLPIPPETKARVRHAVDVARAIVPRLDAAVDTYLARGGGTGPCEANALVGALTDALVGVAEELGAAGFDQAPEVELVIGALGGIGDELLPACDRDAGFARMGASVRARLDAIAARARARGVSLAPLPALRRAGAGA